MAQPQPQQVVPVVQPQVQQQAQQPQPPFQQVQQVEQSQVEVASSRDACDEARSGLGVQHEAGQEQLQQQQDQDQEEAQVEEGGGEGEGLTPIEVPATRFESVVFKLFQVGNEVRPW
jgi:hypothetical protein